MVGLDHSQQMFVLPLLLFAASAPTAPQQRPALSMSASPGPASVPTIRSADSGLGQPSSVSRISMDSFGPVPSVPTPSAVDSIPPLSVGPADLASPALQQQSEVAVKQAVDENLTDLKPSVEMSRQPSITSPTAENDLNTLTNLIDPGNREMNSASIPSDEGAGPKDPKETIYTCNIRQQPVETRYHCSECEVRKCVVRTGCAYWMNIP